MSDFSERHEVEGLALHTPEFECQIAEAMAALNAAWAEYRRLNPDA